MLIFRDFTLWWWLCVWEGLFPTISNKQLLTEILLYMHVTQNKPTNSLFTKPLLLYWLKLSVINKHVPRLSYSSLKNIWLSLTTYVATDLANTTIKSQMLTAVSFVYWKKEHYIKFTSKTGTYCVLCSICSTWNKYPDDKSKYSDECHYSISHLYHTWTACLHSVKNFWILLTSNI